MDVYCLRQYKGLGLDPAERTGLENTIGPQISQVSVLRPVQSLWKLVGLQKQVGDATLQLQCI